ncbi:MAG: ABC-type transport system involved in cytochrome c biogenesis permease subunit [Nitriliruptoraceae bacterium]|jgi:ABC-type transport system involved in cytochrome c biogenesis permease subunit
MTAAELSKLLFSPVTLVLYTVGMALYLYAMAFSTVGVGDSEDRHAKGRRARRLAVGVTLLGVTAHAGQIVARGVAAGRWPLGNMFEFSSVIAITTVIGGLIVVQRKMRRPELMGFVLLGALMTLGLSVLLYSEPGPLQPILNTWWLTAHVSAIVVAAGVFSLAAVFNALYLLRDTAEVRVAAGAGSSFGPGTVGAAQSPPTVTGETDADLDATLGSVPTRVEADVVDIEGDDQSEHDAAYRAALRSSLAQHWFGVTYPWKIALGASVVSLLFSLLWWDVGVSIAMIAALFVATGVAWFAVPFVPSATTLDSLTYRTVAFAFPIWTFAVILGAMWAEQSWGRFWGWDPKETSAFVTWVAYAAYLHARATRGISGRKAAWLGMGAFACLLFTYYAVNLVIAGLHSYGGISQTVGA